MSGTLKDMSLLEALDAAADSSGWRVPKHLWDHIVSRFEDRRLSAGAALASDGHGRTFDEFCAVWADNIRGEQHDDEEASR